MKARGLTLIGFLDDDAELGTLWSHLDSRAGFLDEVAKCARQRVQRNRWARAWFAQFLARRDPVEAWAAFRLFLRCVDRRFYIWGNPIQDATPDLPLLWRQQVLVNEQAIRHAAERNEGKLSDVLFGLQIPKNEIAPWYASPPTADQV
jgi:hypothetical protein